jgi:hypothetical protein
VLLDEVGKELELLNEFTEDEREFRCKSGLNEMGL